MSRIVIDASVAVKWFLPEQDSDAARAILHFGHDLLAPDLLYAEVGSVLPVALDLVINLKAANALCVRISQSVLLRADRVIE